MEIKSYSVTADILYFISDGRHHTLQEIADEVEVSKKTVQKHIQSLSYRYPIETFRGRHQGGVILDKKYIVQGRILTNEKLQILGKALELLQESNSNNEVSHKLLKELMEDFTPPKIKEQGMEL